MSCSVKDRRTACVREHQEIHSGHFMVSNLDDSEEEADEPEVFGLDDENKSGPNPPTSEPSCMKGQNLLAFEELGSLFQYLAIAYTSKLTSPKWNRFRGLRFALKSKIRLNNIIWREYHMQFIKCVKPAFVQFQKPLTENHQKPEAIVMEGKYWKRSVSIVRSEYRLWRKFTKDRLAGSHGVQTVSGASNSAGTSSVYTFPKAMDDLQSTCAPDDAMDSNFGPFLNDIMMELDDEFDLFFEKSINYSFLGIRDIIQPGLLQFQPDTIDEPMPSMQLSPPGNGYPIQNKRASPYINPDEPSQLRRSPCIQITSSVPPTLCGFVDPAPTLSPTTVIQTVNTPLPSAGVFSNSIEPRFQTLLDARPPYLDLVGNVSSSVPLPSSVSSAKLPMKNLRNPPIQERWDPATVGEFQKPMSQPLTSAARRTCVGKRHRRVSAQPGRYKTHASSLAPPNEKALKSVFRSDVHQDSTFDTPALLNLLQNRTELSHESPWFQCSPPADTTGGESSSYCSAPLLCSVLTAPLSSQSIIAQESKNQTSPLLKTEPLKPRHCASEPHRLQLPSSSPSVTDSMKQSHSVDVFDAGSLTCTTNVESFGSLLTSNRPAARSKQRPLVSILKSAPTSSHQSSSPEITPLLGGYNHELRTARHVGPFGPTLDTSKGASQTKGCTFRDVEVISHQLGFVADQHPSKGFLPVLPPHLSNSEQPSSTRLAALISQPLSDAICSSEASRPFGPVLPPHNQDSDSGYPVFASDISIARRRTSSGTLVQERNSQESCSFSSDRSWDEKMPLRLDYPCDLRCWQSSATAAPTTFFESSILHPKTVAEGSTLTNFDQSQSREANLFTKVRSSSTGTLFPVSQPLSSKAIIQDSTTTVSSYGSIEVLSPPISSQSTFAHTPTSCSPPPLIDVDSFGRSFLQLSSEEQRRHAVQARLQALQHLVHFYNLDHPTASRRRHEDHDTPVRVPLPGRVDAVARNPTDLMEEDSLLQIRRPAVDTAAEAKIDDALWTGGSEVTGRASNAATLRQSAELIRYLREVNEAWEVKRADLQNELNALEALNALFQCIQPKFFHPGQRLRLWGPLVSHRVALAWRSVSRLASARWLVSSQMLV
ncbi:unnamed protein product [Dicrocoelium dendriticum]|nr:unnamed protein product [Dicrocoelium dendriticum]